MSEEFHFQSVYAYAANNPIFYIDKNGDGPLPPGGLTVSGLGMSLNRMIRTFSYVKNGDSFVKAYAKASYEDIKMMGKEGVRYGTPLKIFMVR